LQGTYYLNASRGRKVYFEVPSGWRVVAFPESTALERIPLSLGDLLQKALSDVLTRSGLSRFAGRIARVTIVVDDNTRPTPVSPILDFVISRLEESGLKSDQISIVIASGTHSSLSREQVEARLGKHNASTFRVVQHDAVSNGLRTIAKLKDGHEVKINPAVVESDLTITISSILPHPSAGFGGGPKMIMPGVADFESIRRHHIANVLHPNAILGNVVGNPFHEEIMPIAKAAGPVLSINCIYDAEGGLVEVVAGELEAAFRKSVNMARSLLGRKLLSKVDVTITSSFPHVKGPQVMKSFALPSITTKQGGIFFVFAPITERIPDDLMEGFAEVRERSGNDPISAITKSLAAGLPLFPERPMDFNMAVMGGVIRTARCKAVLVSDLVSEREARLMGSGHAQTLEEGLAWAKKQFPDAEVAIFPTGGFTVPLL